MNTSAACCIFIFFCQHHYFKMPESIFHLSHYGVAIKPSSGNITSDMSQKLIKPIYGCTYDLRTYWSRPIKMQTEIAPNSSHFKSNKHGSISDSGRLISGLSLVISNSGTSFQTEIAVFTSSPLIYFIVFFLRAKCIEPFFLFQS